MTVSRQDYDAARKALEEHGDALPDEDLISLTDAVKEYEAANPTITPDVGRTTIEPNYDVSVGDARDLTNKVSPQAFAQPTGGSDSDFLGWSPSAPSEPFVDRVTAPPEETDRQKAQRRVRRAELAAESHPSDAEVQVELQKARDELHLSIYDDASKTASKLREFRDLPTEWTPPEGGGGHISHYKPTLKEFHDYMRARGTDARGMGEDSEEYKVFQDLVWRDALSEAQREGRGIARVGYSKLTDEGAPGFFTNLAGSMGAFTTGLVDAGTLNVSKAIRNHDPGAFMGGMLASPEVQAERQKEREYSPTLDASSNPALEREARLAVEGKNDPLSMSESMDRVSAAHPLPHAGGEIVGSSLAMGGPGLIGNTVRRGALELIPKLGTHWAGRSLASGLGAGAANTVMALTDRAAQGDSLELGDALVPLGVGLGLGGLGHAAFGEGVKALGDKFRLRHPEFRDIELLKDAHTSPFAEGGVAAGPEYDALALEAQANNLRHPEELVALRAAPDFVQTAQDFEAAGPALVSKVEGQFMGGDNAVTRHRMVLDEPFKVALDAAEGAYGSQGQGLPMANIGSINRVMSGQKPPIGFTEEPIDFYREFPKLYGRDPLGKPIVGRGQLPEHVEDVTEFAKPIPPVPDPSEPVLSRQQAAENVFDVFGMPAEAPTAAQLEVTNPGGRAAYAKTEVAQSTPGAIPMPSPEDVDVARINSALGVRPESTFMPLPLPKNGPGMYHGRPAAGGLRKNWKGLGGEAPAPETPEASPFPVSQEDLNETAMLSLSKGPKEGLFGEAPPEPPSPSPPFDAESAATYGSDRLDTPTDLGLPPIHKLEYGFHEGIGNVYKVDQPLTVDAMEAIKAALPRQLRSTVKFVHSTKDLAKYGFNQAHVEGALPEGQTDFNGFVVPRHGMSVADYNKVTRAVNQAVLESSKDVGGKTIKDPFLQSLQAPLLKLRGGIPTEGVNIEVDGQTIPLSDVKYQARLPGSPVGQAEYTGYAGLKQYESDLLETAHMARRFLGLPADAAANLSQFAPEDLQTVATALRQYGSGGYDLHLKEQLLEFLAQRSPAMADSLRLIKGINAVQQARTGQAVGGGASISQGGAHGYMGLADLLTYGPRKDAILQTLALGDQTGPLPGRPWAGLPLLSPFHLGGGVLGRTGYAGLESLGVIPYREEAVDPESVRVEPEDIPRLRLILGGPLGR